MLQVRSRFAYTALQVARRQAGGRHVHSSDELAEKAQFAGNPLMFGRIYMNLYVVVGRAIIAISVSIVTVGDKLMPDKFDAGVPVFGGVPLLT